MTSYPPASNFDNIPLCKKPSVLTKRIFTCPLCKGYGCWNTRDDNIDIKNPPISDCPQCAGYGWVFIKDRVCIHTYQWSKLPNMPPTTHRLTCSKCGRILDIDTKEGV